MTDTSTTPPTGDRHEGSPSFFDSIRDAFDDLAEKATPAVREASARAAELTAAAAAKAAPLARKAGEATAEASGKLAEKSRAWATDLRSTMATPPADAPAAADSTTPDAPGAEASPAVSSAAEPAWLAPDDSAHSGDTPTVAETPRAPDAGDETTPA